MTTGLLGHNESHRHWPARRRCSAYQVACEWLLLRPRTSTPTDFRTSQAGMSSRTTDLR